MGYEKRRYTKIGGLRNVHMNTEKNGKKSVGLNIIRSAGNDWRRKSPDTDTKKETKNTERTEAVIFTIFLLHLT